MEHDERPWGKYFVLEDRLTHKVKRIEVNQAEDFLTNTITNVLKYGQLFKVKRESH